MTREGKQRSVKEIRKILGDGGLQDLDFDILKSKVTAREAVLLNEAQEELPSVSDADKVDDIELQEIVKNAMRSMENPNQQVQEEPTEDLPMQELICLDKQLKSIKGSLKVEVAKKVQLEENTEKEKRKLEEFRNYPGVYDNEIREEITKRIGDQTGVYRSP